METIYLWIKENQTLIAFLWTIFFPVFLHIVLYNIRRKDERIYQGRFNLYKTLVLDKVSNLFSELSMELEYAKGMKSKKQKFQKIINVLGEHQQAIYLKYIYPVKLYDEYLYDKLDKEFDNLYIQLGNRIYDVIEDGKSIDEDGSNLVWDSLKRIVDIMKDGAPALPKRSFQETIKSKKIKTIRIMVFLNKLVKNNIFIKIFAQ